MKTLGINKYQKNFIIVLFINLFVFSLIPLVRNVLPIDAVEGIVWGSYFDLGTHKHPPLAGWLSYLVYIFLDKTDFSIYFLGQLFSTLGLIYIYKLNKLFLSKNKSILATLIMLGCFPYTCMSIMDGFNPNFIMFLTFPAITYYFYLALKYNKLTHWIILGTITGLSFLAKYQTIMLVIPMIIYVLCFKEYRKIFKEKNLYSAILIAFLLFLPHLIWLINHDFFSLNYFLIESNIYAHTFGFGLKRFIDAPFVLITKVSGIIAGTIAIFTYLYIKFRNRNSNFAHNTLTTDKYFIIILGLGPIALEMIPVVFGAQVVATWLYPMFGMIGLLLFYFFDLDESNENFMTYGFRAIYFVITIIAIVTFILFSVELNFRSKYNVRAVSKIVKEQFYKETGKDLRYITGYLEFACPISVYDKTHPKIILDTYGHTNPWIDKEDVINSGVILIYRNKVDITEKVKELLPYIYEEDIGENINFVFTIKNIYNKTRKYEATYLIVKPHKP